MRYRFVIVTAAPSASPGLSAKERGLLFGWALVLALAVAFQLGGRALYDPDEGRNAEVMREMRVSGDYFVPRLNGLLLLDKPLLYYAAGGLTMRALGGSALAARLPGVISTVVFALALGLLASRWWGRRAGIYAGLAAVATPLPLLYSQIVIFDAMLTMWCGLALVALYLAVDSEPSIPGGRASFRRWSAVAWAAMALGTLTKGPVAVLVPLAAILPWAIWRRRASRLVAGGGPLLWLAILLPWVWAMVRTDPDFLHYALVTETWSRLSSDELNRNAPDWYYLPVILFGALPWSIVPISGARRLAAAWRARTPEIRFLLLWFAVPFVIFSLLHSKRMHYILPLVPALVLLGLWLWLGTSRGEHLPGVRISGAIWGLLGLGLLAIGLSAVPKVLGKVGGATPDTVAEACLAVGFTWALAGACAVLSSRSLPLAFCSLLLPPVALLLFTAPLADAIGTRRSARDLAEEIARAYPKGIEVVGYASFPASLPFYLERTMIVASPDGSQLRSNYILRRYATMVDDSGSLRSPAWLAGAALDCAPPRLFVARRRNQEAWTLLAATGRPMLDEGGDYVLFGPCAPAPPPLHDAGRVPG